VTETAKNNIEQHEVKLNDKLMRMIGIPFFGIAIPNLTDLFGTITYRDGVYWLGYIFFIGLAGAIWQGNRYLLFRTRQRFTWFDKPIEKLILLLVNNIFYTAPLTVACLCLWYNVAGFNAVKWDTILIVTLINVICVLFVTHVYETVFMVKEQQNEQLKNSELERAKVGAELTALKNQIDPHFMFNSLNTLTHLIQTDKKKALQFTEDLAEVYRYILGQKDQTLVLLDDELAFTNKYIALLHLRFGNALVISRLFMEADGKNFLIPPTSVFVVFENTVKHNEISEKDPMQVDMDIQDGNLVLRNSIKPRKNRVDSSRIGLQNLKERFRILTNREVIAFADGDRFIVKLPIVQINS
jgi:sensor histidine kinase YesM